MKPIFSRFIGNGNHVQVTDPLFYVDAVATLAHVRRLLWQEYAHMSAGPPHRLDWFYRACPPPEPHSYHYTQEFSQGGWGRIEFVWIDPQRWADNGKFVLVINYGLRDGKFVIPSSEFRVNDRTLVVLHDADGLPLPVTTWVESQRRVVEKDEKKP